MKQTILTGDRPTGRLHLGHYVGSLQNRILLQNEHKQYIMIADTQALTDNFENPEKVISNICGVAIDYLSVGIDPDKTTVFIQSQIPELAEITMYYMNLVTVNRLQRNPTVKNEIKQKNYDKSIPVGFFCYPISQAADITGFKATLVPVGDDQLPMIEQTNEIVRKFNELYKTDFLKEAKAVISKSPRLIGIDGKNKASKSLNNSIFLSDSADEVKRKVNLMYTDANHIKISDPGKIEGNVVFSYLDIFHNDMEELNNLKLKYQKGGLGDTTIKNILNDLLQKFIEPIREKRSQIEIHHVKEMLLESSKYARSIVRETTKEIRNAIGINYDK
ncbi:MAG: tryptophan--tRNA ligase [Rickettsiales bacterium]|nr:MAG: tryptophan--tRNA ligase [Rickettsiales bacterium]